MVNSGALCAGTLAVMLGNAAAGRAGALLRPARGSGAAAVRVQHSVQWDLSCGYE